MALISQGSGADKISTGTTGQRPVATAADAGLIRFNISVGELERWDGTKWTLVGSKVHVGPTPPLLPTDGDMWYYPGDGRLYVYYTDVDSSQWVDASPNSTPEESPAAVLVGPLPPSDPVEGNLWYNTDDGALYVYYTDADSSQWVDASPNTATDTNGFVQTTGDIMTGALNVPAGATNTQVPQVQEVVKKSGDTMTGALNVPAGANTTQAPQVQEVVKKSGDTMTGDLVVPSMNGGPLAGFRNVVINGNLEINQRGVSIASASTGDYGEDRWKKTGGGMTQVIESGNFEPSSTYTLSGTGITTQQITSPATGNWTLPDIAVTARKIQVELGSVATPFERRPIGAELSLCQRYYEQSDLTYTFWADSNTAAARFVQIRYNVEKRAAATVTFTHQTSASSVSNYQTPQYLTDSFQLSKVTSGPDGASWFYKITSWQADAEL